MPQQYLPDKIPSYILDIFDMCKKGDAAITSWSRSTDMPSMHDRITVEIVVPATNSMAAAAQQLTRSMQQIQKAIPPIYFDNWGSTTEIIDRGVGIEPIVAYRDFNVVRDFGSNIYLTSRNGFTWPQFRPLEASCHKSLSAKVNMIAETPRHDAPYDVCSCGIYAFDTLGHSDLKTQCPVYGEVYLWGDVLICESGYRAQYAYPKTLFVMDNGTRWSQRIREDLEQSYGVPTHLVDEKNTSREELLENGLNKLLEGDK